MDQEKWEQIRINAAINILGALIETTGHAIIEEPVVGKTYAKFAVAYADDLINELRKDPDKFQKMIEI